MNIKTSSVLQFIYSVIMSTPRIYNVFVHIYVFMYVFMYYVYSMYLKTHNIFFIVKSDTHFCIYVLCIQYVYKNTHYIFHS